MSAQNLIPTSISSCISLIVTVAMILSIVKYSLAATALYKGDVGAAADIMTEGKRNYRIPTMTAHTYDKPIYDQQNYEMVPLSKNKSITLFVIIWLVIVIGVILYIYFSNAPARAMDNKKWNTIEGKIVSSHIQSSTQTQRVKSGRRTYKTVSSTQYIPDILYEYTINGKKYSNNVISTKNYSSNIQSNVQKLINQYPVDKIIKITYNEENPDESYLIFEITRTSLTYPILSIICVTLLIGFFIYTCYSADNCIKYRKSIK